MNSRRTWPGPVVRVYRRYRSPDTATRATTTDVTTMAVGREGRQAAAPFGRVGGSAMPAQGSIAAVSPEGPLQSAGDLPRTADVVVVGGGVMGACTAYHLARRGVADVVLLERESQLGAMSTGAC